MKALFLLFGVLVLALPASAQELAPRDRGAAMLTRPITAKAELASAFRNCASSPLLRASCAQYLESFQVVDPEADLRTIGDLPVYVENLVEVSCPSGRGVLSRYMVVSKRVDHAWSRDFETGERCLVNNNTNRLVLSMSCGNTILSPRTIARPVSLSEPPVKNVLETDTVFVKDTLKVEVEATSLRIQGPGMTHTFFDSGAFDFRDTHVFAELTRPQSLIRIDTVFAEKKKGGGFWGVAKYPLIAGIGAAIGIFIYDQFLEIEVERPCGCKPPGEDDGGPVNPPNIIMKSRQPAPLLRIAF